MQENPGARPQVSASAEALRSRPLPEPSGREPSKRSPLGSIGQRSLLTLLDQAVVSIASFTACVLIGRVCGAEALGSYTLGLTIVIFASTVHESLIGSPYTVLGHRRDILERRHFATAMLWLHALLSLICVLLLAALGLTADSLGFGSSSRAVVWALTMAIPCALLRDLGRRFSYAYLQPGAALLLDATTAVLQVGSMAVLASGGHLSAATGLLSLGLACGVGGSLWLGTHLHQFTWRAPKLSDDLREGLSFGGWILAARLVSVIHSNVIYWILALRAGMGSTGVFSAGMTIANLANPLVQGLAIMIGPQAATTHSQQGPSGLRRLMLRTLLVAGGLMSLYWLAVMVGGQWLMLVLYGSEAYAGQSLTISILAFNLLFVVARVCTHHGLVVLGCTGTTLWTNVVSLLGAAILALILIPHSGASGAALSLLAGNILGALLQLAAFFQALRTQVPRAPSISAP